MSGWAVYKKIRRGLIPSLFPESYFFTVVSTTAAFTVSITAFVVSVVTTVESTVLAEDSVEPDPHEANPIARKAKAMI